MDPESSSPPTPPLPRSYGDAAVLELEPLRGDFFARELEKRRLSKQHESEWIARIAKEIKDKGGFTDIVKRWLKAISLSKKREFCNFVPPLTDEAFQLFVRFFWYIKTNEWREVKKLLVNARLLWGLEPDLCLSISNKFLESGDDLAISAATESSCAPSRYPTSQALHPRGKLRKSLNAVGRKRDNRPFSSAISKRRVTKRQGKFIAKARLTPRETDPATSQDERIIVDKDVAGSEGVAPDSGEIRRDRKRKLKHNDAENLESSERLTIVLPPRVDKPPKARANTRKRVRGSQCVVEPTVDHGGVPDGPEHSVAKPNAPHVASSGPLVPDPSMLSRSNPDTTCSVGADERAPKRANRTTTKPARKRRSSALITSSRSANASQTFERMTEGGVVTEPDQVVDHTAARVHESHVDKGSSPPFTISNVGEQVPEHGDDPHDCTLSDYPILSSVGSEEEKTVSALPRPSLTVTPPIWAQEVCESLDYFRSFQSGVYHTHDIVKGYLLGAHSSNRDLFHHGGKLIISHGGGKSGALHSKNRRLEIQGPGDQLEDDRSVSALLNNYKSGRPLVVLVDDNYALFPFDLAANGYSYVVLGLYWIAHAWAELQRVDENHSVVRYKFAFQWCEKQGDPWWLSGTEGIPVITQAQNNQLCNGEPGVMTVSPEERENLTSGDGSEALRPEITEHFCERCQSSSPLVYEDTPICLQPNCTLFFRKVQAKSDTSSGAQSTLSYSAGLLRLQPANHQPVSADSIFPPSPSNGATTSRPFAKGLHCRECGRLSTRFKWEDYECSCCRRIYEAPRFVFNHKDFWLQEQALKYIYYRIPADSGIVVRDMKFQSRAKATAYPYVQTFDLPDNRGSVHLIPGHVTINREADALFQNYQRQAARGEIQFRRWPLRAHKCRGQLLSNYFSQNTGSPYQYVGGSDRTIPMEDGAQAVLGALELIKKRIATTLGKEIPFNEVLSAAYMEKQKMAFHSDSERGLGHIIASLSLGSAAEMHFRLQSKHIATEGHRKIAMSLVLRHGDVLVMEGAGVQEYYEHAVVPKNFRIVATARHISPENYMT